MNLEPVAFALGLVVAAVANDDAFAHFNVRPRWQTFITVLLAWSLIAVSTSALAVVLGMVRL